MSASVHLMGLARLGTYKSELNFAMHPTVS